MNRTPSSGTAVGKLTAVVLPTRQRRSSLHHGKGNVQGEQEHLMSEQISHIPPIAVIAEPRDICKKLPIPERTFCQRHVKHLGPRAHWIGRRWSRLRSRTSWCKNITHGCVKTRMVGPSGMGAHRPRVRWGWGDHRTRPSRGQQTPDAGQ